MAAPITWIGGNNDWVDGAGNNANWNPADEPDPDDEAIFNASNSVNLGSSNTIQALTMSGGIDLFLNGFTLSVGGLVQLTGSSTNLFVGGASAALNANNLTINNLGVVELSGGQMLVQVPGVVLGALTINTGGTLSGNGAVNLDDPVVTATVLNNNGTITALSRPANILLPPPIGSLSISGGGALARIDLDGSNENAVVNVNRNQTLVINHPLADTFNGTMNMAQDSTFNMLNNWTLGSGGTLNVDNGAVGGFPGAPAGTSTIAGGTLTQSGGTINVVDTDGTLIFTALYSMNGGNLVNNGLVEFNSSCNIFGSANFTMPTNNSSITVGATRTVTFNQANFNPDGNGQTTNVLTVNANAVLGLSLGIGADESLSGKTQLNGGRLEVTTIDDTWSIDGTLGTGAGTGTSRITGEALTIANANVTVGANSMLLIDTPLTLGGGGSITGTGTLAFNQQTTVTAASTLNMVGGTVDLDGIDAVGDQINVRAPLVINTATMESFGRLNPGGGVNVILVDALSAGTTGSLTVNLSDPGASWTLNPQGNLALMSTNAPLTMLSGSDLDVNGSMTVTGTAGSAARLNIAGTVNLQTASPNGGLLLQGGTLAKPNTITNGQINGPGRLQATSGRALKGFGTIHAPIAFGGTAELIADGGTLNVNGGVDDVGFIRVGAAPAVLNLGAPVTTVITDGGIVMSGGTLQGATLTTSSTDATNRSLRGIGTVANVVVNNGVVEAIGGKLLLNNPNSDWDGAGAGRLRASSGGLLEVQGVGSFGFGGSVVAADGSRVFTNGFGLNCGPASSVLLTNGTLEATATTDIAGTVVVGVGPASTIKVALNSFLDFKSTTTVLLNGDLHLISNNAGIRAGAAFGGTGALIIPEGSNNLVLQPNAVVNVLLDNRGTVYPGGLNGVGRADVKDYQQAASGKLTIEMAGTSLNQYDRLVVNGSAVLAGTLDIKIEAPYVPAQGDTFNIISSSAGVTGKFDLVTQGAFPGGLSTKVIYQPTLVQVVIVPRQPGDMDHDGDVDMDDFGLFQPCMTGARTVASPLPPGCDQADLDGDVYDVDHTDFGLFQRCYSGPDVPGDPACAN